MDGFAHPSMRRDLEDAEAERSVLVVNESGVSLPLQPDDMERLCRLVMEAENIDAYRIEVMYVDEAEISRIHNDFLGDDRVTDNIAFSYGSSALLEGSIAQCAQRILEQAAELGIEPRIEFARILIHGLLHLAGHDDTTPAMRLDMSRLEDRYLEWADFGVNGAGGRSG